MKKSTLLGILGLSLLLGGVATAAEVDNTKIQYIRVAGDVLNIVVVNNVSSPPGCSTHQSNGRSFAISLSTEGGRETARLATAAFLAGRNVKIVGGGTCTVHGNKEDLTDIYLK